MKYWMILLVLIVSCGPEQPGELQKLHDEVMAIHDEVMPKMIDINQAKKNLRNIDDPSMDSLITNAIQRLDDADEAMMAWMAQFSKPDPGDLEAARQYYAGQKESITKVKDQMLQSLELARKLSIDEE